MWRTEIQGVRALSSHAYITKKRANPKNVISSKKNQEINE